MQFAGGFIRADGQTLLQRNIPGYMPTNPSNGAFAPPGTQRRLPFEQVF